MIQITLQFKSLDAALRALREIPENALVQAGAETQQPAQVEAPAPDPKPKTRKPKDAPAQEAAPVQPTAPPQLGAQAPAAVEPPAPVVAIDYPQLQKAVFALAGKDKAAAVAIAQRFGVKTFKDLAQDKWGDAFAAVQEKLADLEAL
jgi:hypothetical protein